MTSISQNFPIYKKEIAKDALNSVSISSASKSMISKNTAVGTSFNKYLVNFTGLNRNVSKTAYKLADSIKTMLAVSPKSQGLVGNLPSDWVKTIPFEKRAEVIKTLYADFKLAIKEFTSSGDEKVANASLKAVFTKAKIIDEKSEFKLKILGEGSFGKVFHLKGISDNKYVIKIFEADNDLFKFRKSYLNRHGNLAESARAAYWQKNAGKNTQMIRFYFGDIDAGYMVNRYIDKATSGCKKTVNPSAFGLKMGDVDTSETGLNKLNGFQYDFGGIKIIEPELLRNKKHHMRHKNKNL